MGDRQLAATRQQRFKPYLFDRLIFGHGITLSVCLSRKLNQDRGSFFYSKIPSFTCVTFVLHFEVRNVGYKAALRLRQWGIKQHCG